MNLTRKLFYNKRNGQATLIIPAKALDKLQKESKKKSPLKISTLSFKILNVNGRKEW
jgi:hypothetical protein